MEAPRIPRATYRLQLHAGFTLADVLDVVPYLDALGVSHLYLSPFLKARAGSQHGYDLIDHNALNPELGDMAALERLHEALSQRGMGIVMDVVPNHMGVGAADNAWWLDVLEWGEESPYARFFDIDWTPSRRELKGKVLLPFLGDHYGAVLERGELVPRLDRAEGAISVWYWQHRFPVSLRDYAGMLEPVAQALDGTPDGDALRDLALDFRGLTQGRWGRGVSSRRQKAAELKARLAGLAARPPVAEAADRALSSLGGDAALLHRLLERQHYRVSFWRVAADEINYRRFFDINDLAALRMVEEPELFERAHRLTLDLVRRGMVNGLRIDHVDGLFNPADYCRMLQACAGAALDQASEEQPIWLVVEKILAHHEPLRRDWPVAGTTGYEFMNLVAGLLVDPEGELGLTAAYHAFTGLEMDFEQQVYEAKKRIMDEHMASELRVLANRLGRIANDHWRSHDFTLSMLYNALREVVACLPVYRTYVTTRRVTDNDRRYLDWALAKARRAPEADPSVFDFLAGILSTDLARSDPPLYPRRAVIDFAMRVQQYTGPVMAKGFEDTALYRFNRLLALNEVGGEPTRFGMTNASFHQANRARQRSHPHSLLATSTHDSKRGEDVRARIAVLSEMPQEWRQHAERWQQLNSPFRKELDDGTAPEANDEYLIYQTLVGAWPGTACEEFAQRLEAVVLKSVREAKRRTSWGHPDEAYEAAVADFVSRILETARRNPFLDDFQTFHARIQAMGMLNGLVQVLLKLTVPGVPDIYQGCELWDLSMVDPDNRRPVDYALRRRLMGRWRGRGLPADPADWSDGAVKQEMIRRVLDLRRRKPELFDQGAYRLLPARGGRAASVVAFSRQWQDHALVVAVPRLVGRMWPETHTWPPLAGAWRGVTVEAPHRMPEARFRDLLSGAEVVPVMRRGTPVLPASDLFGKFPLALLEAC